MFKPTFKLAGALAALLATVAVQAQDSGPLIDALLREGILTDEEAEDLRADLANDATAKLASTSLTPNLTRMTISGRFQSQFVSLSTDMLLDGIAGAHLRHRAARTDEPQDEGRGARHLYERGER